MSAKPATDHTHDWVEGRDQHSVCRTCGAPYYGPGHPEFDAEFRRRWLIQMRELLDEKIPDLTDDRFNAYIAEFDRVRDQFVADLNRDARPNTSAEEA